MSGLKVANLAELVFDRVQHDILTGAIAPFSALRQDALAETLGVSKIPVREALTRLEEVGFVTSHPRKGYSVRQLSVEDCREIFDLRLALEPAAAAAGAAKADSADRAFAKQALVALEAEIARRGPDAGALNRAFHESLMAPAGRHLTLQMVMRLHILAQRYVNLHLQPEGRSARAVAEHRSILAAWLDADTPGIERLVREHIARTAEDLSDQMPA